MYRVQLVPHDMKYAERIFKLSSAPQVKDVLGLRDESVEDTKEFIRHILNEEAEGKTVSRLILDEDGQVIGITTLMFIDREKRCCHIGSWLGYQYWGKGYNQEAKILILKIAFLQLDMEHVFAGARIANIRSQKAQEKLPYMRIHVEEQFPEEHDALEGRQKQPCILNAVYREDFMRYLQSNERGI